MAAPKAPYIGRGPATADLDDAVFGEELPHVARARDGARRAERAPPRHRVHQDPRRGGDDRRQGLPPEGHRPRSRRRAVHAAAASAAASPSGPSRAATRSRSTARRAAGRCAPRCRVHAERGIARRDRPRRRSTRPPPRAPPRRSTPSASGRALIVLGREGEETCAKSFRNITRRQRAAGRRRWAWPTSSARARLVLSQAALDALTDRASPEARRRHRHERAQVIIRPIVSRRATRCSRPTSTRSASTPDAHKTQIRQAVEEIFGVRVSRTCAR